MRSVPLQNYPVQSNALVPLSMLIILKNITIFIYFLLIYFIYAAGSDHALSEDITHSFVLAGSPKSLSCADLITFSSSLTTISQPHFPNPINFLWQSISTTCLAGFAFLCFMRQKIISVPSLEDITILHYLNISTLFSSGKHMEYYGSISISVPAITYDSK